MQGYSDRIDHALAFAAKHHDQQVRRGTKPPYFTQPANVGLILARYGRDDTTVIAGILHSVAEDSLRSGYAVETLRQRILDKFGDEVLETVLTVSQRRTGDDGVEFSYDERREDILDRLGTMSERARWVLAAIALHNTATALSNLRRTVEPSAAWNQLAGGRTETVRWYRRIHDRLRTVGFYAPIMDELESIVRALETWRD